MNRLIVVILLLLTVGCNKNDNGRTHVDFLMGQMIEEVYIKGAIDIQLEQAPVSSNGVRVLADVIDINSVECKMVDNKLYITLTKEQMGDTDIAIVLKVSSLKMLSISSKCNVAIDENFFSESTNIIVESLSILDINGDIDTDGLTANVSSGSELHFNNRLFASKSIDLVADALSTITIDNLTTSMDINCKASGASTIEVVGLSLYLYSYNMIEVDENSTFLGSELYLKYVDISLDEASKADINVTRGLKYSVLSASTLRYTGVNVNIVEEEKDGTSTVIQF